MNPRTIIISAGHGNLQAKQHGHTAQTQRGRAVMSIGN